MNLEHKEKQEVFDSYAKEKGHDEWESLLYDIINNESIYRADAITEHVMKVTDLIQRKALKRAISKAKIGIVKCDDCNCEKEFYCRENRGILKESITNENNLIK